MNNERPKIIETGIFCLSLDKVRAASDYYCIIIVILANAVVIKHVIQLLAVGLCSQFSALSLSTICDLYNNVWIECSILAIIIIIISVEKLK